MQSSRDGRTRGAKVVMKAKVSDNDGEFESNHICNQGPNNSYQIGPFIPFDDKEEKMKNKPKRYDSDSCKYYDDKFLLHAVTVLYCWNFRLEREARQLNNNLEELSQILILNKKNEGTSYQMDVEAEMRVVKVMLHVEKQVGAINEKIEKTNITIKQMEIQMVQNKISKE